MADSTPPRPLTGREWILSLLWALFAMAVGGWVLDQLPANVTGWEMRWPLYDVRNDDQAYVASRIHSGEGRKASVVVLGNSSIREAFWPDARMTGELGAGGHFLNLASSLQNAIEALFLAELMEPGPGQTFVVFLNATSLRQENPLARLEAGMFLQSPVRLRETGALTDAWSNPAAAQMLDFQAHRQLFQRIFRVSLKHWAQEHLYGVVMADYKTYRYESAARPSQAQLDAQESLIHQELTQHFAANLHRQSAALDALQRVLRQRGARLVLATAPQPARALAGMSGYEAELASVVGEFVRNRGIEWLDLNQEIVWQADDFFDLTHLAASGRDKWSQAFINWLAARAAGDASGRS